MSEDPEKTGAVSAGADDPHAATAEADAQAQRTESHARGVELREEIAITDERRAEEEEAKAQDAVAAAEQEESKKEAKRRAAEERKQAAVAESERAREQAANAATQAQESHGSTVSGAAVSSPGVGIGSDPKAAAVAAAGSRAQPDAQQPSAEVEGPEKPEIHLAAAFVGAFLFARVLKRITS